jgi:hypothetical protein
LHVADDFTFGWGFVKGKGRKRKEIHRRERGGRGDKAEKRENK